MPHLDPEDLNAGGRCLSLVAVGGVGSGVIDVHVEILCGEALRRLIYIGLLQTGGPRLLRPSSHCLLQTRCRRCLYTTSHDTTRHDAISGGH
ncbi:hypothetical protein GUJ93_ZPchr0013g37687 [Zizania palustris]|uniref:Uncharacterized protein n=1 Tax=Zizania palustris TaxID=103762 RepID=A0A8J6BVW1_ZIZPA|nr:hypothetical protein GUJ93_ZPchr0013g37687 [Zizania palustris]